MDPGLRRGWIRGPIGGGGHSHTNCSRLVGVFFWSKVRFSALLKLMFELVESLQPKKLTEENLEMWEIPQSVCYTSRKIYSQL